MDKQSYMKEYLYNIQKLYIKNSHIKIHKRDLENIIIDEMHGIYKKYPFIMDKFIIDSLRDVLLTIPVDSIIDQIPMTQSIIDYYVLSETKKEFDYLVNNKFINKENYNLCNNIMFGSVISNNANAQIMKVPEINGYIILINSSLMDSVRILAKIIENLSEIDFDLKNNPICLNEASTMYNDLMMYIKTGITKSMIPFKLSNKAASYAGSMRDFIIAHEYAHYMHSHFYKNTIENDCIGNANIQMNWADEYEADDTAFDLVWFNAQEIFTKKLLQSGLFNQGEFEWLVADMSLTSCAVILNFFDHISFFNDYSFGKTSSHPPIFMRLFMLLGKIKKNLSYAPEFANHFLHNIFGFLKCFDEIFQNNNNITLNKEKYFQNSILRLILEMPDYEIINILLCVNKYLDGTISVDDMFKIDIRNTKYIFRLAESLHLEDYEFKEYIEKNIELLTINNTAIVEFYSRTKNAQSNV